MFDSFGFSNVAVSTAVVTTGVWNLGFKSGLPIVAVVLMAVTGHSAGRAVGAALGGVALIAVSGTVLWLVFRDEASARWAGRVGDRILNWVLRFARKSESHRVERALLHFREQTSDTVHEREDKPAITGPWPLAWRTGTPCAEWMIHAMVRKDHRPAGGPDPATGLRLTGLNAGARA